MNDNMDTGLNANNPGTPGNKIKDPADWTTGDEPMTEAQRSYLQSISGSTVDDNLTKAQAAQMIEAYKQNGNNAPAGANAIKDPENWTTGGEEMTEAQTSYLKTLATEAGEQPVDDLTKAEASKKIEELQQKTGRGA